MGFVQLAIGISECITICELSMVSYLLTVFSRYILCLYCIVYYVYDNPTYEVANKLICILYLVTGHGIIYKEMHRNTMAKHKNHAWCGVFVGSDYRKER